MTKEEIKREARRAEKAKHVFVQELKLIAMEKGERGMVLDEFNVTVANDNFSICMDKNKTTFFREKELIN